MTYHPWVEPVNPAHGGGRLAPVPGLWDRVNNGHSRQDAVANGQDTIDVGIEAANDLDGPGKGMPALTGRGVMDAAQ
jgi:hypothetical protein